MSSSTKDAGPHLLNLPIELFGSIIPDPAIELGYKAEDQDHCGAECSSVCYISIKRKPRILKRPKACCGNHHVDDDWWVAVDAKAKAEQEPVRDMLFALSHTCKQLRAYCLPLLWRQLHVGTVDELGSLRDLFRDSPSLPLQVRNFTFSWNMGSDVKGWESQDTIAPPGVPLVELAFGDRIKYFTEWDDRITSAVRRQGDALLGKDRPDYGPPPWEKDKGFVYLVPTQPSLSVSGKGPDGFGEDKRIKNVEQLNECLSEVVESLANLEAFRWATFVMSVPEGVMQALEKKKLRHLWYRAYAEDPPEDAHRASITWPLAHSYWRCAGNLFYLNVTEPEDYRGPADDGKPITEMYEEDFWKEDVHPVVEKSALAHLEMQFRSNDHHAAALRNIWQTQRMHNVRTVIAAAKGGNLRYLYFWSQDEVYAIRSLVPAWVNIFRWNGHIGHMYGPWLKAAASLRPCLSHFARWHNGAGSTDQHLTPALVQTMAKDIEAAGGSPEYELLWPRRPSDAHPLTAYCAWLSEDADLAKLVSEAWNAVVDRGEANRMSCSCAQCQPNVWRRTWEGFVARKRQAELRAQHEAQHAGHQEAAHAGIPDFFVNAFHALQALHAAMHGGHASEDEDDDGGEDEDAEDEGDEE